MTRTTFAALCQGLAFFLILVLAASIDSLSECGAAGWIAAGTMLLAAWVLVTAPDRVRAKRKPPLVRVHKQGARWTSHHEDTVIIANYAEFDKG